MGNQDDSTPSKSDSPGDIEEFIPGPYLRIPRSLWLYFIRPAKLAQAVLERRWDLISQPVTFLSALFAVDYFFEHLLHHVPDPGDNRQILLIKVCLLGGIPAFLTFHLFVMLGRIFSGGTRIGFERKLMMSLLFMWCYTAGALLFMAMVYTTIHLVAGVEIARYPRVAMYASGVFSLLFVYLPLTVAFMKIYGFEDSAAPGILFAAFTAFMLGMACYTIADPLFDVLITRLGLK